MERKTFSLSLAACVPKLSLQTCSWRNQREANLNGKQLFLALFAYLLEIIPVVMNSVLEGVEGENRRGAVKVKKLEQTQIETSLAESAC